MLDYVVDWNPPIDWENGTWTPFLSQSTNCAHN
jgi:hypothetical protein